MTARSQHLAPEACGPAEGLWHETPPAILPGDRPCFDRNGVIVEDTQYLSRAQDVLVLVLAGAGATIARCNTLGTPVVLVSNQSVIARGLYDWCGFAAVQAAIASALADAGV